MNAVQSASSNTTDDVRLLHARLCTTISAYLKKNPNPTLPKYVKRAKEISVAAEPTQSFRSALPREGGARRAWR
jgi:hypothetical protein